MKGLRLLFGVIGTLVTLDAPAIAQDLPAGPNRDVVYRACEACHPAQYLLDTGGLTRTQWGETLRMMEDYGAQITPQERTQIVEYLATFLPPGLGR